MTHSLLHRNALVTGSTGGIGAAIAQALAAAGAFVVVSGRDPARGRAVVQSITDSGGHGTFVQADLADGEVAIRHLAERAQTATSDARVDILVNNAAQLIAPTPTAEVPAELITRALAVNVTAPFLLTGILAPAMAARGYGAVVNVGSINGLIGMANSALYGATKTAVHSLTKSWAAEYAARGVRVNTIAPGPTATERNTAVAEHLAPLLARTPSGRMSTPDEIASAVVFLASDAAPNMHGATLVVDGGFATI
ncbi:NAD(P)-dependent dehydrogenase (short-subunit alcohol dehydrogenase family) [Jatrophihabitans sp. GAS493]|uniref:SDR family NAD(P)-dependent oxidoreductase n=1 Tax=Jatrophihabitans sp. GAS493 TaxID=1907575 RepID=UPI000BB94FD2|nr:SDR family oxidoreductase [Jatrophihabitans sp. GAS493]SOD72221.1 NAD(P)-dependent dehydrogenase (short-subunit alcohol dehydrogenase family) [Jatrophihabitans sp. GAS493]